mmetsp:Transcript_30059/g.30527  ORF Transcript_30059/g.30527 Transcript_30059/m.30527 type:complete len:272 (+) Transcript_30059:37-852(+)
MRFTRSYEYFLLGAVSASVCIIFPKLLFDIFVLEKYSTKKGIKVAILFGDSITQQGYELDTHGWISSLSNWWIRKVEVINKGFSGYNSRNALKVFHDSVISTTPKFVTIFFGANDASIPEWPQHVPLQEYRTNIEHMILTIQKRLPQCVIVLITPPPIWEEKLKQFNIDKGETNPAFFINRTNSRAKMYAEVVTALAQKYEVGVIDLWHNLEGSSEDRKDYLIDGLHLNSKGNKMLFKLLTELVSNQYSDWLPENIDMYHPHWTKLVEDSK